MAILKLNDKRIGPMAVTATALWLAASVIFFMPVDIPSKVTIPAGLLALASLWLCPWQITLALLFSALGDYMGSVHNFMGQMGFFAVGHIWYIAYFAGRKLLKWEKKQLKTV